MRVYGFISFMRTCGENGSERNEPRNNWNYPFLSETFNGKPHLSADVAEKIFDVFPDEKILHDGLPVVLQNQLELVDVVVLVRGYEIRHCHDFRVVFVRLRLLKEVPSVRMYFSGQRDSNFGVNLLCLVLFSIWTGQKLPLKSYL